LISQSAVVFCLMESHECPLRRVMIKALEEHNGKGPSNQGEDNGDSSLVLNMVDGIAGRVLRASYYPDEDYIEVWMRVSGTWPLLKTFENKLKQEYGITFQVIFSNKFNTVYRITIEGSKCPHVSSGKHVCPILKSIPGAMLKTSIISPYGFLCELIVSKASVKNELRRLGCHILTAHGIEEYDYMLTHKQELAVLYAYLTGYYKFPRKISLKDLSYQLGLSVSTLAELIRKAEAKIIEAFIRHELPHYLVGLVMSRTACKDFIESKFSSRGDSGRLQKKLEKRTVVEAS